MGYFLARLYESENPFPLRIRRSTSNPSDVSSLLVDGRSDPDVKDSEGRTRGSDLDKALRRENHVLFGQKRAMRKILAWSSLIFLTTLGERHMPGSIPILSKKHLLPRGGQLDLKSKSSLPGASFWWQKGLFLVSPRGL